MWTSGRMLIVDGARARGRRISLGVFVCIVVVFHVEVVFFCKVVRWLMWWSEGGGCVLSIVRGCRQKCW